MGKSRRYQHKHQQPHIQAEIDDWKNYVSYLMNLPRSKHVDELLDRLFLLITIDGLKHYSTLVSLGLTPSMNRDEWIREMEKVRQESIDLIFNELQTMTR